MSTTSSLSAAERIKLARELEQSRPLAEWDSIPALRKWKEEIVVRGKKEKYSYNELVIEYKKLGAEIDIREALRKELKSAIETGLLLSEEEALACEGYKIQRIEKQGSKKVDEMKLLEHGVSAKVIADCTVQGKSSVYVDIRKMKEQE